MGEGSFSVEAAFILPIVIFTVLSLVFYSFYLRDIVFVETVVMSVLFDEEQEGSVILEENNDVTMDDTFELINELLWWGVLTKWNAYINAGYIEYEINANIFGFRTVAKGILKKDDCIGVPDRIRLFKSIIEEAEELIFAGGNTDGH